MGIIDKLEKNTKDIDNQFEDLVTSDMQLQDLEGSKEATQGLEMELKLKLYIPYILQYK